MLTTPSSLAPGAIAFGYIRVSGDIQTDRGLPVAGQRRALEEYCASNNLLLERVFVDESKPGSSDQREQFQAMMELAHRTPPACSAILLWSWSRFSRDQDDAHFWKASLRRHNVQIIDVSGETPVVSGFEYVVESLIHWKDQQRLVEISTSSRRGQQTLAKLGYMPSGACPPRGFIVVFEEKELEGKKRKLRRWVPDPATSEAVTRAWQMRLAGKSYEAIWRACGLYKNPECFNTFFSNPIYKGELHLGATIIPVPAIVTPEEWARVNANRGERRSGAYARRVNSPSLLSGLAMCALCGSMLQGEHGSAVKRNDGWGRTPWHFYHCLKSRKRECSLPRIDAHRIETAIIRELLDQVLTVDNLQMRWALIAQECANDRAELEARVKQLTKQLRDNEARANRLVDAIEQAGITPRITERLQTCEVERVRLEHELSGVKLKLSQPPAPDIDYVLALHALVETSYEAGDTQGLRELLKGILECVVVDREEVTMQYRFPFTTGVCPVPQRAA